MFASGLLLAAVPAPGSPAAAATSASAASETLSVTQCAALARRQAPAASAAALDERAAALDSTATAFNRRPEYFVSAGAMVAPDGWYDPAFTNLGEYHTQIGVDWTLTDGGRRQRARERARLDLLGARARRQLASREAGESAVAQALRSLRLAEVEAILSRTREGLGSIGALVRSGVRSGVRSPADSIRLGLAEEDAALDVELNAADAATTALDLREALGRGLADPIAIRAPAADDPRDPAAADSLRLLAGTAGRPELALAQAEEAGARLQALEARRQNAPELTFTVDAGLVGTDLTRAVPRPLLDAQPSATFADRLDRDLGASAAFSVRFPIFDASRAPASAARTAGLRAAEQRRAGVELHQQREAAALFTRWRSAAQRLRSADAVVGRAESHYLRTKSLYAAGATTLFDLLDALQLFRDARVRRAEAREDLRFVQFQIEDRR